MGKWNARQWKRCVSYNRYVFHQLLFQPIQMCKTFRVVPLPLTCPSRINLTQTNNFTGQSVEGMFCFNSLIACRCNCGLKNICNSTCWQLNYTAVTLSRLVKNYKLNETSQSWELRSYTQSSPTNCASSFFENREGNLLK